MQYRVSYSQEWGKRLALGNRGSRVTGVRLGKAGRESLTHRYTVSPCIALSNFPRFLDNGMKYYNIHTFSNPFLGS